MKKNISLLIIACLSLLSALFSWNLINVGSNLISDAIKFYSFLVISILPTYFFLKKQDAKYYSFFDIFNLKENSINSYNSQINIIYIYIITLFIFISFFTFDPNNFYLDIYHDGFSLTPSMNFLLSKSLWGSSFVESGLYPNFKPIITYFFLGKLTIGSKYFLTYVCTFLNKFLLLFLTFQIINKTELSNNTKVIFLLLSLIFILPLATNTDTPYFAERHLLLLFFLNFIFFNIYCKKKTHLFLNSFFLAFISIFSIFWWFDIFIFINSILFLYLLTLIKTKKVFNVKILLLFQIIFIVTIFLSFPKNELNFFTKNLYSILFEINKSTYIKYPNPTAFTDGRALKTLLFFSYSGFLTLLLIFNKQTKLKPELRIFFLLLFISSVIIYLFALGRSDSYHIKQSSGVLIFNLIILNGYFFFRNKTINNFVAKKINFLIINFFLVIFLFYSEVKIENLANIKNFNNNLKKYNYADDVFFLKNKNSNYINLIKYYKNISQNDDCVQILTDETLIPYLLKKQTCSKYFFYHIIANPRLESALVSELENNLPNYILYDSDLFNFNFSKKLNLVQNFILNKYEYHEKYLSWTFYKLKAK